MTQIKIGFLIVVVACFFSFDTFAATARGVRRPAQGAPAASTERDYASDTIPYITCVGRNNGKDMRMTVADYQGGQSIRFTGPGASDASRDLIRPVQMTATRSGTDCILTVNRGSAGSPVRIQYSTDKNQLEAKILGGPGYTSPSCGLTRNAAFDTLKSCRVPAVRTRATMPETCRPSSRTLAEQTYSCDLAGEFQERQVGRYSMSYCNPNQTTSSPTDRVCVARVTCRRRANLPAELAARVSEWPTQYPSYVACRPVGASCSMSANNCRADKSIYYTNPEVGVSKVKIDVGLELPGTALSAAPQPAPAAPAAPAPVANPRFTDQPAGAAAPVRVERRFGTGAPSGSTGFEYSPGAR